MTILPTFEAIANIAPLALADLPGTPRDLCRALNEAIEPRVPFGEYGFMATRDGRETQPLEGVRWLTVAAVPGSNEGYYVHLTAVPSRHDIAPSRLIGLAKTWSWAEALAIAAIATRLLNF
jgi:hypothetical protein